MSTEKIKETINQYFDNELSKGEEVILFTELSENEEARNYFKEMNFLRTAVEDTFVDYPPKMDEKILSGLKPQKVDTVPVAHRGQIFNYISYAFAIILLAISIFFYTESIQYKNKLDLTSQQVNQQNQLIQVLYHTLPQTVVTEKVENEIIVTPKM